MSRPLFEGLHHRGNHIGIRQQIARGHAVLSAQRVVDAQRLLAAIERALSIRCHHGNLAPGGIIIGVQPGFKRGFGGSALLQPVKNARPQRR